MGLYYFYARSGGCEIVCVCVCVKYNYEGEQGNMLIGRSLVERKAEESLDKQKLDLINLVLICIYVE